MKKYLIATLLCLSSFAFAQEGEKNARTSTDSCVSRAEEAGCGPCKKRCYDVGSERNSPRKDISVAPKSRTTNKEDVKKY